FSISQSLTLSLFYFNDTAPTEIYTLSLHDALPISPASARSVPDGDHEEGIEVGQHQRGGTKSNSSTTPCERFVTARFRQSSHHGDRKSTRLNSSHVAISYAVFCLKKKKKNK